MKDLARNRLKPMAADCIVECSRSVKLRSDKANILPIKIPFGEALLGISIRLDLPNVAIGRTDRCDIGVSQS